jgi:alpha-glucosidase
LKVIVDQVWSHTSDQHPWFQTSRQNRTNDKADWYVWADPKPDGMPPNNWLSRFGGVAWEWDARREQYYLHNFLAEQPDLNLHHPEVQAALLEIGRFWLDLGVDGCRFDVANYFMHNPALPDNPVHPQPTRLNNPYFRQVHQHDITQPENLAFVERIRRELFDAYPDTLGLAEILSAAELEVMATYTSGEHRFHTAYSFVFFGPDLTPSLIRQAVETVFAHDPTAWPSWAFSNHDSIRAVSRLAGEDGNRAAAKLLVVLVTSLPGNGFIYQGEELGLPHGDVPFERLVDPEGIAMWPNHQRRDGARTPMPWQAEDSYGGFSTVEPWLPLDPRHRSLAVDISEADAQADSQSCLEFTRRWLALRKLHAALRQGEFRFLQADEAVLWFERWNDTETLSCCFNLGATEQSIHLENSLGNCLIAEAAEVKRDRIHLGSYGFVICELECSSAKPTSP